MIWVMKVKVILVNNRFNLRFDDHNDRKLLDQIELRSKKLGITGNKLCKMLIKKALLLEEANSNNELKKVMKESMQEAITEATNALTLNLQDNTMLMGVMVKMLIELQAINITEASVITETDLKDGSMFHKGGVMNPEARKIYGLATTDSYLKNKERKKR